MHRSLSLLLLALAALVFGTACPADPRDQKKVPVVARVGAEEIFETELLSSLAQHGTARIVDASARGCRSSPP